MLGEFFHFFFRRAQHLTPILLIPLHALRALSYRRIFHEVCLRSHIWVSLSFLDGAAHHFGDLTGGAGRLGSDYLGWGGRPSVAP